MNNLELWREYKSNPSDEIKKEIVMNYVKLVHYVIHNSRFINLNVADEKDYFQFGIEGLNEAIDRFDPEYGTKFETYAIQRIRGKIIDELRKLQIKPRVYSDDPNRVQYSNIPLASRADSDDEGYSLEEVLPGDSQTPEELSTNNELREILIQEIKNLNKRDRLIITLYYYESLNYKDIAEVLDITVSRVSQVHSRIIKNLKERIQNYYEEPVYLAG